MTRVLARLPNAAMIVFYVVRHLYEPWFWITVLAGVMIGIGLSLIWLISVATRPRMPLLGRESGTQAFRELDEHPEDEQFPGVVVLRLDGGLFFATSDALKDRVREGALSTPEIAGIVIETS